jgi:hypothetical protein
MVPRLRRSGINIPWYPSPTGLGCRLARRPAGSDCSETRGGSVSTDRDSRQPLNQMQRDRASPCDRLACGDPPTNPTLIEPPIFMVES